jgi:hypothetical protein
MSTYRIHVPSPDDSNYHEARQQQRVQAALKRIDPGEVIATIESRLASEPDPRAHPLFPLVSFYLDRQIAVDGGAFYDHWKRLILAAIDTCLDNVLAMED